MSRVLGLLLLVVVVLAGCRAVDAPVSELTSAQTGTGQLSVVLDALDNSIPLGDSFPIGVNVVNAPPNSEVDVEFQGEGITPSLSSTTLRTDGSGRATLRIGGVATLAQLTGIVTRAYTDEDTAADMLFVDFSPQQTEGLISAQMVEEDIVGEPTTVADYYDTLPVAESFDEIEAYNDAAEPPPALIANNVSFPDENGNPEAPINAVIFSTNEEAKAVTSVQAEEIASEAPTLTAQACSTGTYVFLKSKVGATVVNMPARTKVIVEAPGTLTVTKWVGDNGRLDFNLCGQGPLRLFVYATTNHGLYIHSAQTTTAGRIIIWSHGQAAANANNIRGTSIQMAPSTMGFLGRATQGIWFRLNQVYNWELSAHNVYTSFPVDLVYPARDLNNNARSRSAVGQIQLIDGDFNSDRTIFHEFGHEVYYRRILGGSTYGSQHRGAVSGRGVYPLCIGELSASIWKEVDGCTGMLEGFAVWFESITTRALGVSSIPVRQFDPEIKPTGSSFGITSAVPGRVAQALVDLSDSFGSGYTLRDSDNDAYPGYVTTDKAKDIATRV